MSALAIWWFGIFLEGVILVQAMRSKAIAKYPVFFAYIAFVMASEVSRFIVHERAAGIYVVWWWSTEFIGVLLGYWVLLDILEKVLSPYTGAKKFARNAGLLILFVVLSFTTFEWLAEKHSSLALTSVEVERNLRSAEAALLCVLLVLVVAYYGVSIGRNLRGILLGYGTYIALDVMVNATRSFLGHSFQGVFSIIRSYSYLAALIIWTYALWSYVPVSTAEQAPRLEADYQSLASATREKLGAMRSYLGRSGRK
jgi:hypothetical protein